MRTAWVNRRQEEAAPAPSDRTTSGATCGRCRRWLNLASHRPINVHEANTQVAAPSAVMVSPASVWEAAVTVAPTPVTLDPVIGRYDVPIRAA